jgi:hypothetical protein
MCTNRIECFFPEGAAEETQTEGRRRLPGDRVRVQTGIFAGVEGTVASYFSGSRLIIELDLDCTGVTLEIDERMVGPAAS